MTSLSSKGYAIVKECLDPKDLEEIRSTLTVKPYNIMDAENNITSSFPVYKESKTKIYVPKVYGLKHFGIPDEDHITNRPYSDIEIKFNGDLREDQKGPVSAYLKAANNKEEMGGIINLQCAAGKTVMALYIACALGKKTLVVVHKEFLLDQWKERISQFVKDAKVGYIKGPVCDVNGKDIVIGSLQSLSMKEYDSNIFDKFGFVIYDEAHHTSAQVFSRIFQKVTTQYTLGLSATVNRKDGLTKVFKWHIGDIVYKGKKKKDVMKILIKEFYEPNHEYSRPYLMFNKKPNISKMINNICEYTPRTKFIIKCLQDILIDEPNRRVLVLSDRRNHLVAFKQQLDEVGISSGFYYGGLKPEVLQESEKQQVLLGTYAYVSEGFDMKGLNTMILASPKSDVIQSIGRITRDLVQDREYPALVLDIVDNFSIFPNQGKKRLKYYQSQNYDIEKDTLYDVSNIDFKGKCYITMDDEDEFSVLKD